MNRRFAAVLVPLLGLSLVACTKSSSNEASADPKAALVASTSGIKTGNYSFAATMPSGATTKAVVHTPSKSAALDIETIEEGAKGRMQVRVTDPARFVKLTADMSAAEQQVESLAAASKDPQTAKMVQATRVLIELFSGKNWLKTDLNRVTSEVLKVSAEDPDMAGVNTLFTGIATAKQDGSVISGTLDATVVKDDVHLIDSSMVKGVDPAVAKAIPYTATLDGEGRLSKLVLDLPKSTDSPAGKFTVEFTGYGAATKQEAPPAAEVKDMPAEAYEVLNSKD
ncbi:hypothetical protein [Actinoplanes sp. NPDC051859]|uniref:hypothetical protein n=1 Tax=Actinoplanes sp. NPDC051859 TaxID=3363909 RepID=UPI0037894F9A